jgi:hypothetical protein
MDNPFEEHISKEEKKNAGIPEELIGVLPVPEKIAEAPEYDYDVILDRKKFIEEEFKVRAKTEKEGDEQGQIIPFKLNQVQSKYYDLLIKDKGTSLDGTREIILKARQQGFSTFILALFAVDFITKPHSVSICISHQSDATRRLFKRVHFYIESYCARNGFNVKDYLSVDTKDELENATNGAYFYLGTAGAKVGGRGDTVTNLHFSEAAFYQDTEKITPKEIIEATIQQVPQEHGMIFIESTGGHYGSYYQGEWERAKDKESNFTPRFFNWQELYTPEWIEKKRKDFQSEAEFKTHYPSTEEEAFIYSGDPFFDREVLLSLDRQSVLPIYEGRLASDGNFI